MMAPDDILEFKSLIAKGAWSRAIAIYQENHNPEILAQCIHFCLTHPKLRSGVPILLDSLEERADLRPSLRWCFRYQEFKYIDDLWAKCEPEFIFIDEMKPYVIEALPEWVRRAVTKMAHSQWHCTYCDDELEGTPGSGWICGPCVTARHSGFFNRLELENTRGLTQLGRRKLKLIHIGGRL
jgi:hypothetical protein